MVQHLCGGDIIELIFAIKFSNVAAILSTQLAEPGGNRVYRVNHEVPRNLFSYESEHGSSSPRGNL